MSLVKNGQRIDLPSGETEIKNYLEQNHQTNILNKIFPVLGKKGKVVSGPYKGNFIIFQGVHYFYLEEVKIVGYNLICSFEDNYPEGFHELNPKDLDFRV